MDQVAGHDELPEGLPLVGTQAMQYPTVVLMHAVADQDLAFDESRRTDDGQFEVRLRLRPGNALLGGGVDFEGMQHRYVERTEARNQETVASGHGGSDEVVDGLFAAVDPQNFRRGGSRLVIAGPGALGVAAVGGPRLRRPGHARQQAQDQGARQLVHQDSFCGRVNILASGGVSGVASGGRVAPVSPRGRPNATHSLELEVAFACPATA